MATRNVLPPDQMSSLIPPNPHILQYQDKCLNATEINPIHSQEIFHNREMLRLNNAEWLERERNQGTRSLPPDVLKQREWLVRTREYETRKRLEREAYYHANQEYIRLMNEDQSRQSFREKQRLTEDLEKQKRLLLEDLARDEQLRQDQHRRRCSTSALDVRGMRYVNSKNEFSNARGNAGPYDVHMLPNGQAHAQEEVPYTLPLAGPKDFYAYRRLQDTKFLAGKDLQLSRKDITDMKQCVHSNLSNGPLMPIIQEKEQKIKEMEEKLFISYRSYVSKPIDLIEQETHPSFAFGRKVEIKKVEDNIVSTKENVDESARKGYSSPIDDLIIDVEEKEEVIEEKEENNVQKEENKPELNEKEKVENDENDIDTVNKIEVIDEKNGNVTEIKEALPETIKEDISLNTVDNTECTGQKSTSKSSTKEE